jgi:hypothetical protein
VLAFRDNDKIAAGVFNALKSESDAMVRRATEYSKRRDILQEADFAAKHLRKSRGKLQFMDARNKWNGARKVMKEADFLRVSSRAVADFAGGSAACASLRKEIGGRVNALEAISHNGMKQTLNAVVEVTYTTGRSEVTG